MDQFLSGSENLCGDVFTWYLQLWSGGTAGIPQNPECTDGQGVEKRRVKFSEKYLQQNEKVRLRTEGAYEKETVSPAEGT